MAFPLQLPDVHAIAIAVQSQPWFHTDPNPHKTSRRRERSHPDFDPDHNTEENGVHPRGLRQMRSVASFRSLGDGGRSLRRKVSAWSVKSMGRRDGRDGDIREIGVRERVGSGGSQGSEVSEENDGVGIGVGVERERKRGGFRGRGMSIWRTISRG